MKAAIQDKFNALVESHGARIFRLGATYLSDHDEASDLYQEVLLNIWQSLPRFKGQAQLSTWVYRITVNTAITYQKKEKRRQEQLANPLPATDLLQPMDPQEYREPELQLMERCISQMKEDDRLLIGLLLEDASYQAIADILGISLNTAGVKIKRVKDRLSRLMKENVWTLNN